jgi:hypothetical protein
MPLEKRITDIYREYGAKLKNVQWSVSAWNDKGELVVTLWQHHLISDKETSSIVCEVDLNRWSGLGNDEFRRNVQKAYKENSPVRMAVVRVKNKEGLEKVKAGTNASEIPKSFSARKDWVGHVVFVSREVAKFSFLKSS